MRLKTIPRQRRPIDPYATARSSNREDARSTDIAQGVNVMHLNLAECGRILDNMKKSETEKIKMLENSGVFSPKQFSNGRNHEEAGFVRDVKGSVQENFQALNLSTKNGYGVKFNVKNETLNGSSAQDGTSSNSSSISAGEKLTGSLLYRIMTDPTFVENIKNNKEIAKLTCKFCKNKFGNYSELQSHLESRLNEFDRITCCACGKTFGQKRYLRYHQRCHVVNDKFTCDICTKKYSRMDNLTRHKTYHTNPHKYPCSLCDKTFSRRDLMTKHAKSHDAKKFNCEFCAEFFFTFAEMEAHRLALHTVLNVNFDK